MTDGARLQILTNRMSSEKDPRSVARLAGEALHLVTREENPLLWANLQGCLGASLVEGAAGAFDDELVDRILAAYGAALSVYDPKRSPDKWLTTQRNLGATHVLAAQHQVGDARIHVEKAITAYEMALELGHRDSAPSVWLQCQQELTVALRASVAWRGFKALTRGARACREALEVVAREVAPEVWASLKIELGRCLFEAGTESDEAREDSIRACEDALQILQAEAHPFAWATAHLVLGGGYRRRRLGDRAQNLERAIECVDCALSVYTPQTTPHEWYCAHYQRGPAYAFRIHGDQGENQERALQSLEIAIRGAPDDASEMRASLQLVLGDVYRDRIAGDPIDNFKHAVMAFESVAKVFRPDRQRDLWFRAKRSLGHVYLEHKDGNAQGVERAIAIFEEVQSTHGAQNDMPGYCVTYMNLAAAYLRRNERKTECNRAHAVKYLERALEVPMEAWADPASWLSAQQQLALLLLCSNTLRSEGQFEDGVERVGASLARGAASASAQTPKDNKRSDVFDLAALARQQSDSLSREIATGQETIEHDPDWHVPFLLNEEAALLAVEFKRFLKSGEVWSRTRPERTELERSRMQLFQMVLEHLAEKYEAARQTRTLFRELEAGTRGFVLLLRGFASRAEYRAGISIVRASDLSEKVETVRLAQKVAPIALVWVGNPAESGPLDAVEAQIYRLKDGGEATGFRIEMGSSWERDIRGLISNASFIIVHNPTMTEGVVTEIRLVQELGRRGDTFFYAPEKAAALLGLRAQDCTALDDLAIERMRVTAAGRPLAPGTLPKPTCLWIGGDRRILFEAETSSLRKWINSLTSDALVTLDLRLDANMCLLAHTLLLERLALVPPVLLDLSTIMRSFREEHLEDAEAIADRYAFHAGQLERALMECAPGLSLVEQTAEALQKLLGRKL